jgi:hypothetical protein
MPARQTGGRDRKRSAARSKALPGPPRHTTCSPTLDAARGLAGRVRRVGPPRRPSNRCRRPRELVSASARPLAARRNTIAAALKNRVRRFFSQARRHIVC